MNGKPIDLSAFRASHVFKKAPPNTENPDDPGPEPAPPVGQVSGVEPDPQVVQVENPTCTTGGAPGLYYKPIRGGTNGDGGRDGVRQGVRGYYNAPMPLVILWKLQEARCTLSDVMLAAAIYGVGRMRKTSDVRLDKQVKAVARLSKNTFLRSVDRLEAAKCFLFTRAPGRSIVAHIVWKSK